MTAAGDLNRRLVLQAPVETGDGAGGVVIAYQTVTTLWAQVTPKSGRGDVTAASLGALVTHTITIRAGQAVTTRSRFQDGARIYRVVAIRDSDDRRFLVIDAEERED